MWLKTQPWTQNGRKREQRDAAVALFLPYGELIDGAISPARFQGLRTVGLRAARLLAEQRLARPRDGAQPALDGAKAS